MVNRLSVCFYFVIFCYKLDATGEAISEFMSRNKIAFRYASIFVAFCNKIEAIAEVIYALLYKMNIALRCASILLQNVTKCRHTKRQFI